MINHLNFSLFPYTELLNFSMDFIAVVEESKVKKALTAIYLAAVKSKFTPYQIAFESEMKNPYTRSQLEKDEIRNAAFIVFRSYCEWAKNHDTDSRMQARRVLLNVIRQHAWNAQDLGYIPKSTAITNIVSDIISNYSTELKLIAAEELLDDLAVSQLNFEGIVPAAPVFTATVSETRPQLVVAIQSFLRFISLQEIFVPTNEMSTLITELNVLSENYYSTLKTMNIVTEKIKQATA